MRSLFARLRRRFAQRPTGAELRRRTEFHFERLSRAMPTRPLLEPHLWRQSTSPGKVAVIGAGFAGLCAAYEAFQAGFDVTVFETTKDGTGGRVVSSSSVVPGRLLELGAELIGTNHPFWIAYARFFGFGLSVVTTEDLYDAARLSSPMWLDDKLLSLDAQEKLYTGMANVFTDWSQTALSKLPDRLPWTPWAIADATDLDGKSLGSQIPLGNADLVDAISTQFYLDNCVDPAQQSWLANLAQFSAGSIDSPGSNPLGFFDDTEVFRCESANQTLAFAFRQALPPAAMAWGITVENIKAEDSGVWFTDTRRTQYGPYDYAILAVPLSKYPGIRVNGDPLVPIANGPAVKYLAPLENRFWIGKAQAPSGMSDKLGMTWEGTDNQMLDPDAAPGTASFDLSVFMGGKLAQTAMDNRGTDAYFLPLLRELYPDFPEVTGTFANWPGMANIATGYSCPATTQVTTIQKDYTSPKGGRLFLAGEHTSPAWFGYMEGALQSGHVAVMRMCRAAGIDVEKWGSTAAL